MKHLLALLAILLAAAGAHAAAKPDFLVDGQSQQWKSMDGLAAPHQDVAQDRTAIVCCHDGFRSTLVWLQLKALGHRDVRVCNGGWADWDRTLTLPVVKGARPFDADFEL